MFRPNRRALWLLGTALMWLRDVRAQDINLSPTRPTIANSVTIPNKGVLQVETGYDAYPQNPPGNQQTLDVGLYYVPLDRLRVDFVWSAFTHQQAGETSANGVSTVQIGGKVLLRKEKYHHWRPGLGLQYEAELPTASQTTLQGFGQQAIFLVNHHYGPNGNFDLMVNGSIVQSDCQMTTGCAYGGQQSIAVSYHLSKPTRLYAEVFGQNVPQSNTPPGTYVFGGFLHQLSDSFGLNGGLRFGISDHASSIGTTVGLVFGRRVHRGSNQEPTKTVTQ